jgi:hypothetical protein
MVRAVGIEPTLLAEPDFESGASTSFTTPACAHAEQDQGSFMASARNLKKADATPAELASSPLLTNRRPEPPILNRSHRPKQRRETPLMNTLNPFPCLGAGPTMAVNLFCLSRFFEAKEAIQWIKIANPQRTD